MPKPPSLTAEQYAEVASTFDAILDADLSEAAALDLIRERAGADAAVAESLRSMLAAHMSELASGDDAGLQASALEAVGAEVEAAGQRMAAATPRSIGPYEIVRFVAAGGMGAVYEALQHEPRRRVAIKVIRFELLSPSSVKRFEAEGHLLARLRHEGIAQVFAMGRTETPSGVVPYLVLEYVDGTSITAYARENQLDTTKRIELLRAVCRAVQYAHDNGVLHRDLKPGNILVDGDGHPRVLDFGIARSFEDTEHQATLTASGMFLGTLAYMSPEQAVPTGAPLDVRVDVYGIGAVGYEVLTGVPPHDLEGLSIPEAVERISRHDPRPMASHDPALAGDLTAIFRKALSTDRDRRYRSAHEFDEDLRRVLEHEPITARAPSAFYQVRKLVRRNRLTFALLALILFSLVVGLGLALGERSVALEAKRAAQRTAREAERERYAATLQAAWSSIEAGSTDAASDFLATELPGEGGIELALLRARAYGAVSVDPLEVRSNRVVCISPDGRFAVAPGLDGSAVRIDLSTRESVPLLRTRSVLPATTYEFVSGRPDWLMCAHGDRVDVVEVGRRRLVHSITADAPTRGLDEASSVLAVAYVSGRVHLLDLEHGALVRDARLPRWQGAAVPVAVRHGRYLIRILPTGGLEVLDLKSGTTRSVDEAIAETSQTPLLSPDGRYLVHRLSSPVVYDFERGDRFHLGGRAGGVLADAVLNEAGNALAILDLSGRVTLWDLDARRPTFRSRDARLATRGVGAQRHRRSKGAIRFRPDERGLVTIAGGKLATWSTRATPTRLDHAVGGTPFPHVYALAWHPEGRWLASAAWDDRIVLWDTWTGRRVGELNLRDAFRSALPDRSDPLIMEPVALAWSPDGNQLAAFTWRHFCACWSIGDRTQWFGGQLGGRLVRLENNQALVVAAPGGAARHVPLSSAAPGTSPKMSPRRPLTPPTWTWHDPQVPRARLAFGFAAAGNRVAAGRHSHDGTVDTFTVWERGRAAPLWAGRIVGDALSVELADAGQRLLIGTRAGTIQIHDVEQRRRLLVMRAHEDYIIALSLSPDGTMLASGSGDGWVRLDPLSPVGVRVRRATEAAAQHERILPRVQQALADGRSGPEALEALRADAALAQDDRRAAEMLLFSLQK